MNYLRNKQGEYYSNESGELTLTDQPYALHTHFEFDKSREMYKNPIDGRGYLCGLPIIFRGDVFKLLADISFMSGYGSAADVLLFADDIELGRVNMVKVHFYAGSHVATFLEIECETLNGTEQDMSLSEAMRSVMEQWEAGAAVFENAIRIERMDTYRKDAFGLDSKREIAEMGSVDIKIELGETWSVAAEKIRRLLVELKQSYFEARLNEILKAIRGKGGKAA